MIKHILFSSLVGLYLLSCSFAIFGMQMHSEEETYKKPLIEFFSQLYATYHFYELIDDNIDELYTKTIVKTEDGKSEPVLIKKDCKGEVVKIPQKLGYFEAKWNSMILRKSDLATKLKNKEATTHNVLKCIAKKYLLEEKNIATILLNHKLGGALESALKSLIIECITLDKPGKVTFCLDQVPEMRPYLPYMFKSSEGYDFYIKSLQVYKHYVCHSIDLNLNNVEEIRKAHFESEKKTGVSQLKLKIKNE